MALTKTDKEFIELKVKDIARMTAEEVANGLPCLKHESMILEHNKILHDGLQEKIEELDKDLKEHLQETKKYNNDKRKGKRRFWTTIATGTILGIIMTVIGILIGKVL